MDVNTFRWWVIRFNSGTALHLSTHEINTSCTSQHNSKEDIQITFVVENLKSVCIGYRLGGNK